MEDETETESAPSQDGRLAKGQKTQDKLIEALVDLAAQGGLAGVSAGKLAQQTGVSTGTIFHHFKSIEGLSLKAMQQWFEQSMQSLEGLEAAPASLDAYLAALAEAGLGMADDTRSFRATMAFLHRGFYEETYREALAPFLEGYAERQRALLARYCGRKPDDPKVRAWAQVLSACLDGLAMQAVISQDRQACRKAFDTIAEGLKRDLGPASLRKGGLRG